MVGIAISKRIEKAVVLVASVALMFGCTTGRDIASTPAAPHVTPQEFGAGIAFPTIQLVTLVGAFYAEKQEVPDRESLSLFSQTRGEHIDWQRFPLFEVSESAEDLVLRLNIVSPASTSESGHINTSWKFHVSKKASPSGFVVLSITPLSPFCIDRERKPTDDIVEFFVALAIASVTKVNAYAPSRELCFVPSSTLPVKVSPKTDQKSDEMRERLRERLRRKESKPFLDSGRLYAKLPNPAFETDAQRRRAAQLKCYASFMKYVVDTNIINRLLDGTIRIEELPTNGRFVASHVQTVTPF